MSLKPAASLVLFALLGLLAFGSFVSACSGPAKDKNEASPCCGATGSVEQPPAAFALGGATFAGIRIKPVIYTSNACPSFSDPLETVLELERAGPTTNVDATTGAFQLTLTENALGKKVAFVACDEDCEEVLGFAILGAEVAQTAPGEFLNVGVITLTAPSGALGTSSLELLADCELDVRNIRGGLVTADVRHVLTDLVTYSAAPTTAEVNDLMARLQLFDAAMQVARDATGGQVATFDGYRTDIEAIVDNCLAGNALPGCTSSAPPDAEFFRYYQFARLPSAPGPTPDPTATAAPGPLPPEDDIVPFATQTWAQQISDKLGDAPPLPTDLLTLSMMKQNAMFRHQLMEKAVVEASAAPFLDLQSGQPRTLSLSFSSAGLPSITESLAQVRTAIVSGSMADPASIYGPWQIAANDIGRNLDLQLGGAGNATFANLISDAIGLGTDVNGTLDASSTPTEAFQAVYDAGDGTNGAYQATFILVGERLGTGQPHLLTQQLRLTDIVFFVGYNAAPPVTAAFQ